MNIIALIGLIFLFLAAFNLNFPYIASGWFGLALIYFSTLGVGVPLNPLLVIALILLILVLVVILINQLKKRQTG